MHVKRKPMLSHLEKKDSLIIKGKRERESKKKYW
jgi:hypothetical protein